MAECTSDPTSGCDTSQIVTEISGCCVSTGTKLDSINSKLEEIKAANALCCTTMTNNQERIIDLLTTIANK